MEFTPQHAEFGKTELPPPILPPGYDPGRVLREFGPNAGPEPAFRAKHDDPVAEEFAAAMEARTGETTVTDAINNWGPGRAGRHLTLRKKGSAAADAESDWTDPDEFSGNEDAACAPERRRGDRKPDKQARKYKSLSHAGGDPSLHQRGLYQSIDTSAAPPDLDETGRHAWFLKQALKLNFPMGGTGELDGDLERAIGIYADNMAACAQQRKVVIAAWERRAAAWRDALGAQRRFGDPVTQRLAENTNFPIVFEMLQAVSGNGLALARALELGFPVIGLLDEPKTFPRTKGRLLPIETRAAALAHKDSIVDEIKRKTARDSAEDTAEIWRSFLEDCSRGSLCGPYRLQDEEVPDRFCALRRFVVWQKKPDGRVKPRPCDDALRGRVNGLTACRTPVRLDSFATLAAAVRKLQVKGGGRELRLFGEDESDAYKRRITKPSHARYAVVVALGPDGELWAAYARVMLFGTESSVFNFNLWSLCLSAFGRTFLNAVGVHYFDDHAGVGFAQDTELPADCRRFLAIPGAMFGPEKSKGYAEKMVFLGALVEIQQLGGVKLGMTMARLDQIRDQIAGFQREGALSGADAEVLAGRLQFSLSAAWGRAGRAFLYPVYQGALRGPAARLRVGKRLTACFDWWSSALLDPSNFERQVESDEAGAAPHSTMISDATPKMVAAVWIGPDRGPGRARKKEFFAHARTDQIDRNECAAFTIGFEKWAQPGEPCMIWIDNETAQGAAVKGYSSVAKLLALVKRLWLASVKFRCPIWLERVPTAWNVADAPSRGSYDDLLRWGFQRVAM